MTEIDKRSVEIKAKLKGFFIEPWANNNPQTSEKTLYWLVDDDTTLPANLDPATIKQMDEMLNSLPDKLAGNRTPEPEYGDGTES